MRRAADFVSRHGPEVEAVLAVAELQHQLAQGAGLLVVAVAMHQVEHMYRKALMVGAFGEVGVEFAKRVGIIDAPMAVHGDHAGTAVQLEDPASDDVDIQFIHQKINQLIS